MASEDLGLPGLQKGDTYVSVVSRCPLCSFCPCSPREINRGAYISCGGRGGEDWSADRRLGLAGLLCLPWFPEGLQLNTEGFIQLLGQKPARPGQNPTAGLGLQSAMSPEADEEDTLRNTYLPPGMGRALCLELGVLQ